MAGMVQKYLISTLDGEQFGLRFKPDEDDIRKGTVEFFGWGRFLGHMEAVIEQLWDRAARSPNVYQKNKVMFSWRLSYHEFKEMVQQVRESEMLIEMCRSFGELLR